MAEQFGSVQTKVLPVGLPEPDIDRRLLSPTGPLFEHCWNKFGHGYHGQFASKLLYLTIA